MVCGELVNQLLVLVNGTVTVRDANGHSVVLDGPQLLCGEALNEYDERTSQFTVTRGDLAQLWMLPCVDDFMALELWAPLKAAAEVYCPCHRDGTFAHVSHLCLGLNQRTS